MSSELKTNKISPATGTALQIADSGDTITIPSGATLTNSGTATGFTNVFDVYFQGQLASAQTVSRASNVKVTGMTENEIDSDSAFDGTTFTVPSGKGGIYIIFAHVSANFDDVGDDGMYAQALIFVNGSATFNGAHQGTNSGPDTFTRTPISLAFMKNLSAGDTVELYVNLYDYDGSGDGKVVNTNTSFGGFRLS